MSTRLTRRPPSKVRCRRRRPEVLDSYDAIVDAYIRDCRSVAQNERTFFKSRGSLPKVIRWAAHCKAPNGKRHPHHQRRSQSTLKEAESILLDIMRELRACKTFDALHTRVREAIWEVKGVGPLLVYDVATWIGASLGRKPDRVYLHTGAAKGAAALGFFGRKTIYRHELPEAFARLRCCEIEDCLCSYKSELENLS